MGNKRKRRNKGRLTGCDTISISSGSNYEEQMQDARLSVVEQEERTKDEESFWELSEEDHSKLGTQPLIQPLTGSVLENCSVSSSFQFSRLKMSNKDDILMKESSLSSKEHNSPNASNKKCPRESKLLQVTPSPKRHLETQNDVKSNNPHDLPSPPTETSSLKNSRASLPKSKKRKSKLLDEKENVIVESKPESVPIMNEVENRKKKITTESVEKVSQKTKKPKKNVTKKKKETFQDKLFHTMLIACKPFTLKSLSNAMNVTECEVNSVMLSLLDKNLVMKKEFNTKNRSRELYWANQDASSKEVIIKSVSVEEKNLALNERNQLLRKERLILEQISQTLREPSNVDIDNEIKKVQENMQQLDRKIEETKLRIDNSKGSQAGVDKSPQTLKKGINTHRNEWKKRKEKCLDFIDNLSEAMEKKLKDVFKILDIETDKEVGAIIPPKYELNS